ncbi:MAG: phosphatase PAP2 family protein [Candidatus Saccharimonadales bacterium]
MIRKNIQSIVKSYDSSATFAVAQLPKSTRRLSKTLGRMTLPSIWALTVIVASLIALNTNNDLWAQIGFIVVACLPIAAIIKFLVRRERPNTNYAKNMKIMTYSFPSSHAYAAALAGGYMALFCLAVLPSPLNSIIPAIYLLLVVAIGISRVHIGAHFPTDVTAGWLLGGTALYVITTMTL